MPNYGLDMNFCSRVCLSILKAVTNSLGQWIIERNRSERKPREHTFLLDFLFLSRKELWHGGRISVCVCVCVRFRVWSVPHSSVWVPFPRLRKDVMRACGSWSLTQQLCVGKRLCHLFSLLLWQTAAKKHHKKGRGYFGLRGYSSSRPGRHPGRNTRRVSHSRRKTSRPSHSDSLPPVRIYFLKVLWPSEITPHTGDQEVKHLTPWAHFLFKAQQEPCSKTRVLARDGKDWNQRIDGH